MPTLKSKMAPPSTSHSRSYLKFYLNRVLLYYGMIVNDIKKVDNSRLPHAKQRAVYARFIDDDEVWVSRHRAVVKALEEDMERAKSKLFKAQRRLLRYDNQFPPLLGR